MAALCAGAALFLHLQSAEYDNIYSLSPQYGFEINNLDDVVAAVRSALKDRSSQIGISLKLKNDHMDDIAPLVKEIMELAWDETGIPDEGDYLRYQSGGYSFTYSSRKVLGGYMCNMIITPDYYTSADQETAVNVKCAGIIESLGLPEDASEYDIVRSVYDYLAMNVTYDAVHRNNGYHTLKATAYGALVNGSATCQGYAVSMYRLLRELGIECRVITGEGFTGQKSESHAWNIVRVDGSYYYSDPTWNYTVRDEDYFLCGSADFPDHIPDKEFEGMYDISEYGLSR